MSQRSVGSCTRCTRSNAFPATQIQCGQKIVGLYVLIFFFLPFSVGIQLLLRKVQEMNMSAINSTNSYENMESAANISLFVPTIFEIVHSVEFVDPYDSIWLKLITIGVYLVQILSALVNIAFVTFETRGLAGHYRTLVNQLLSYLYGAVIL